MRTSTNHGQQSTHRCSTYGAVQRVPPLVGRALEVEVVAGPRGDRGVRCHVLNPTNNLFEQQFVLDELN